jgi:DNA (cytosine-5)-methyltransferase 1
MTVGSLFSGIGGFDLAARWMGWRTAWYSEIDPYACRVMARHFPAAVNHGDITTIKGENVEPVDLLCGGFPCQDISLAGKGAGIGGSRSGLWSEFARLIGEIHPKWVVAENVSALRSRGLTRVLQDFGALGYAPEWHCVPASAVGAPHQRDRVWIIAYSDAYDGRLEGRQCSIMPERTSEWVARTVGPSGNGRGEDGCALDDPHRGRHGAPEGEVRTGRIGSELSSGWSTEPDVGRVAHGVPARVDRLRGLGNAIVPHVAHYIFQSIERYER